MAKAGMNSFLLDCHTNDNISEIEAEYGVKGFAVVVRLWQKIYAEKGYYCEWIERSPLLFLSNWFGGNSGVTLSLIENIVNRCLKNGIFDAGMHENYSILTSARIQKQYFDYVKRRGMVPVKKEYLLVSVANFKGIVYENEVSACKNSKNVCRNDVTKPNITKQNKTESVRMLEEFLSAYPKDCFRHLTEVAYLDLVTGGEETEENLVLCAKNYAESCRLLETPEQYIKNAENFLREFVYEKYLPGKYKKPEKPKRSKAAKGQDFPQREYNFEDLEGQLLQAGGSGN